ncbi:MAG: hypothetical protein Q9187_002594, partial [Circinaria calcarea]
TFFHLMSLRTGTSLATLSLLLNKLSGLYGLLALLTGLHLSPLQLSMYIYSLIALIVLAHLAPHVRKQSPLETLALAWVFVIDGIINAGYTAVFATTWFLVISQATGSGSGKLGLGGETVNETAGFTSPKYNVSHVEVVAAPAEGLTGGQDAVAVGAGAAAAAFGTSATTEGISLGPGFVQPESISSLVVILALWAVRIYLTFIVLSYARFILRQHTASVTRTYNLRASNADSTYIENPFASHLPAGFGWRGKLGRVLVSVGTGYWLGKEDDDAWMSQPVAGKTKRAGEVPGVVERERRRRSGTGPPAPAPPLVTGEQGQYLRVQELKEGR